MAVNRIDFLNLTVLIAGGQGLRAKPHTQYKPNEWPSWDVSVKGGSVTFTHESGETVEVPRMSCVIYSTPDKEGK